MKPSTRTEEPATTAEATNAAEAVESAPANEFVEYLGEQPYGTEFIDGRIITRKQAKDGWDISIPKDLHWTKDRKGRMLLPKADVPAEALEVLLEDKAFKVVSE